MSSKRAKVFSSSSPSSSSSSPSPSSSSSSTPTNYEFDYGIPRLRDLTLVMHVNNNNNNNSNNNNATEIDSFSGTQSSPPPAATAATPAVTKTSSRKRPAVHVAPSAPAHEMTYTFHVNRSILSHHCVYFETVTQDATCDTIDLPSPLIVSGYTITPDDLDLFLQCLYDRYQTDLIESLDTIDGIAALCFYFDCKFIHLQCQYKFRHMVNEIHLELGEMKHGNQEYTQCKGTELFHFLNRAIQFHFPHLENICINAISYHYVRPIPQCIPYHTMDQILSCTHLKHIPIETWIKLFAYISNDAKYTGHNRA